MHNLNPTFSLSLKEKLPINEKEILKLERENEKCWGQ